MPDKAWKVTERKVADLLGGERVPVTGRQRGATPDVEHPSLSIEVKSRRTIPAWLHEAGDQATASSRNGKLPVTVLHQQGQPYKDALCVIRLADLAEYLNGG